MSRSRAAARRAVLALPFLLVPLAIACSHGGSAKNAHPRSAPMGKLETIQQQRYPSTSEAPIADVSPKAAADDSDLIKVEGQSSGKPGLVLLRAMDGAQALGYTIVVLEERGLYFVAEKRPGLLGQVIGGTSGICKIAVGTESDPDTGASVVKLKGRSQNPTVRAPCERDMQKLLQYARGEVIVKPKKPARRFYPELEP